MKKILIVALVLIPLSSFAAWQGKLDLTPVVNPLVIRELHDGNWLAGYAKPNLWHLDKDGREWFHAGIWHAWRTDHGDPAIGLSAGVNIGDMGSVLGAISDVLGLDATAKWTRIIGGAVSIDGYGGYRPVHGPDVHDWAYGIGAMLTKKFGLPDLAKGL